MTNQTPGFGVNDLKLILNLIDAVSARGAIRPNEMKAVGEVHERISNFLASIEQQAKERQEAAAAEAEGQEGESNG